MSMLRKKYKNMEMDGTGKKMQSRPQVVITKALMNLPFQFKVKEKTSWMECLCYFHRRDR